MIDVKWWQQPFAWLFCKIFLRNETFPERATLRTGFTGDQRANRDEVLELPATKEHLKDISKVPLNVELDI